MGYEIEISLELRKNKKNKNNNNNNTLNAVINGSIELAENNECERHFIFSEYDCDGVVRRTKKKDSQVLVFCFKDEKFTEMSNFLKGVIEKYKKRICIESIYEVEKHNLIYASPYYISSMDIDNKDDYKHRRTTRAFSDTDYYILREILKKNY